MLLITSISCNEEQTTKLNEQEQVFQIKHRLYYGECLGYCDKEIIIEPEKVLYIQRGWTETEKLPQKDSTLNISSELINQIFSSFNIDSVFALDSEYQPRDEIDNGYITIEIITSLRNKIIKFNTQKYLQPLDSLNKLINLIRKNL